jgi:hypothetical protein
VRGHPLASRNHRNTQCVVSGSMQYLPISSNRCSFQYDIVVLWKLRVLGYRQKDKYDSLLRYLQLARLFSKEICQTRSCVIDRERVGPQMLYIQCPRLEDRKHFLEENVPDKIIQPRGGKEQVMKYCCEWWKLHYRCSKARPRKTLVEMRQSCMRPGVYRER